MRKTYILALLITMVSLQAFGWESLRMMNASNYFYGPWEPAEDDPELIFNPTTGYFESGVLDFTRGDAFKFYIEEPDSLRLIAPLVSSPIQLNVLNPYSRDLDPGKGAWILSKFADQDAEEGKITISLKTDSLIHISVTQIDPPEEKIPEALYIWGSIDGADDGRYFNMGVLLPTDEDSLVFTGEFPVPDVPGPFDYWNPEFKHEDEEDWPTHGFIFLLSPEQKSIGTNRAMLIGGYYMNRTLDFSDVGETLTIPISNRGGGAIFDLTPGKTEFILDYAQMTLTAIYRGETTGVHSASREANSIKVFNLQGIHILTTTTRDDLQNLPSGLYIINGKRTLIP